MTYMQRIAAHLKALCEAGMTQRQLAHRLGFKTGNVVNMHMNPESSIAPFPLKRLPALCACAQLDPREAMSLVLARTKDHGDAPTQLDPRTLKWILSTAQKAKTLLARSRDAR